MRFSAWLLEHGLSEKTVRNYNHAISGSLTTWAMEHGIAASPLEMIDDSAVYEGIRASIELLPIYLQRNAKGKGMYAAALKKYSLYLESGAFADEQEDIASIYNDPSIANTEKVELVKTRLGQGGFRRGLIEQWNGCSVTGYKGLSMLIASHIKPWRESNNDERLDPQNGLLLLPNLDKAFDLGFISFAETGTILISETLPQPQKLGINEHLCLTQQQHGEYMEYHRSKIFQADY